MELGEVHAGRTKLGLQPTCDIPAYTQGCALMHNGASRDWRIRQRILVYTKAALVECLCIY